MNGINGLLLRKRLKKAMLATQLLVALATAVVALTRGDDGTITIDDGPGVGRMFDGIGGLSGGGVGDLASFL